MKLPNAELAVVEQKKIVDYLLNSTHPLGASKARFSANSDFARTLGRSWPLHFTNMDSKMTLSRPGQQVSDRGMRWKASWSRPTAGARVFAKFGKWTRVRSL